MKWTNNRTKDWERGPCLWRRKKPTIVILCSILRTTCWSGYSTGTLFECSSLESGLNKHSHKRIFIHTQLNNKTILLYRRNWPCDFHVSYLENGEIRMCVFFYSNWKHYKAIQWELFNTFDTILSKMSDHEGQWKPFRTRYIKKLLCVYNNLSMNRGFDGSATAWIPKKKLLWFIWVWCFTWLN